jgi:hypothetical protein
MVHSNTTFGVMGVGRALTISVCSSRISVAVWISALILLAACGSARRHQGNVHGDALVPVGPQSVGELALGDATHGYIYYLGFPELTSRSSQPIHVTGFRLGNIPQNIQLISYVVYSAQQFDGRLLLAYDPAKPETSFDFNAARPLKLPYVIRPHARSTRFAMAKVRVRFYPPPAHVSGCLVYYTAGSSSQTYQQELPCKFQIGQDVPSPRVKPTELDIVNSYPQEIVVVGCPVCKRGGARVPSDEGDAKNGEGPAFGWTLNPNDPLTATVRVGGHQVECYPPRRNLRKLTYNIRRDGRCVLLRG